MLKRLLAVGEQQFKRSNRSLIKMPSSKTTPVVLTPSKSSSRFQKVQAACVSYGLLEQDYSSESETSTNTHSSYKEQYTSDKDNKLEVTKVAPPTMSNSQLTLLTPKKTDNKGLVPNEFGKYVVIPLP
eukprot:7852834-Ditylum_brightwellii.AAC.1